MKIKLSILLLLTCVTVKNAFAQRMTAGVMLGTNAFFQTRLSDKYVISQNSYYTYYTFNEDKDNEPIFNQYMNNMQAGLHLGVDYKRFALQSEVLLSSTGIRVPMLYPSYLGAVVGEQWNTFEVREYAIKTNLLVSVKILSRSNSPFLLGGIQYFSASYREDQGALDSGVGTSLDLFISDHEMYGTLYNEYNNYFNLLGGVGFNWKNNFLSLRYSHRVTQVDKQPNAKFFKIELLYAYHLVFQKLRKGHKIYME